MSPDTGSPALEPDDSPGHPLAALFEQWRADRRAARAPYRAGLLRRRGRRRAVVTIVHDESVFLPIWLRYYSRFFAAGDIYVLDNGTTDGSTSGRGFVRVPVERDAVDWGWLTRTVQDFQHDLVGRYEVVLVCDADEIVAPVPAFGDLGRYLDGFREDWVNCLAYELLHIRDSEPPFDPRRRVLDQRRRWFANDAYDKPLLATVPMRWRPGFHGREDFEMRVDPDLRLIHLHRMDFDICRDRHEARARRRWADDEGAQGAHNRITEERAFERWFYEDSCFPGIPIVPEPISPRWRGVL